jgi:hypothetical protein
VKWMHRHNGCIGITLFRFGRRQLEVWYCPGGEVIKTHCHEKIDSTLIILAGEMEGTIGSRTGKTGWYDFLRRFRVPRGVLHSAKITGRFCIFANYERWTGRPSSAAVDFTAP